MRYLKMVGIAPPTLHLTMAKTLPATNRRFYHRDYDHSDS